MGQGKSSILIVAENPFVQLYLEDVFWESFVVRAVSTGREAIKRLKAGRFDIALINEYLPDVSAHELLRDLSRRYPETSSVMMITEKADAKLLKSKYGAAGAIVKPFSREGAFLCVEDILRAKASGGNGKHPHVKKPKHTEAREIPFLEFPKREKGSRHLVVVLR